MTDRRLVLGPPGSLSVLEFLGGPVASHGGGISRLRDDLPIGGGLVASGRDLSAVALAWSASELV